MAQPHILECFLTVNGVAQSWTSSRYSRHYISFSISLKVAALASPVLLYNLLYAFKIACVK